MPFNIDDAQRVISSALLRGPRDPRGESSPLFQLYGAVMDMSGEARNETPVVGVATTRRGTLTPKPPESDGDTIILFLLREVPKLVSSLRARIPIPEFPIETLVTGPIVPIARPAGGGMSIS